jgi:hypothetical protein
VGRINRAKRMKVNTALNLARLRGLEADTMDG